MSKSEQQNGWDRAAMERMSTAELEDLLLRDFHAQERGEDDMSGLYQAAQVLAEREPDSTGIVDRAWESFREKCLPFAADFGPHSEDGTVPSSDAAHGRRHSHFKRWGIRAAVAAAVLGALLLSISVAAAAKGCDLRGLLALWTSEQIWLAPGQISPMPEDDIHIPEEPREYAGIQEALEDYGLTRPLIPQWLPEGFVMDGLVTDCPSGYELIFSALYTRDGDNLVMLVSVYLDYGGSSSGSRSSFQKDDGDPILYEAGGVTHLLTTNAGRPVAVWANGPAECALSGDVTMEELERMIDSIYE